MAGNVPGAQPVNSTYAPAVDPSTSTILAELDSSNFGAGAGGIFDVSIWIGCSTVAHLALEHCTSTGLGSTAIAEKQILRCSANLTPQYKKRFTLGKTDRIRVRPETAITGTQTAEVKLQAEEIV